MDSSRLELFEKYVRHYAACLGLTPEWEIWVSEEDIGLSQAEATSLEAPKKAWVKLSPREILDKPTSLDFGGEQHWAFPSDISHLAAHEVCHIMHQRVRTMMWNIAAGVSEGLALKALYEIAHECDEAFVDDLAKVVVRAFPIEED